MYYINTLYMYFRNKILHPEYHNTHPVAIDNGSHKIDKINIKIRFI